MQYIVRPLRQSDWIGVTQYTVSKFIVSSPLFCVHSFCIIELWTSFDPGNLQTVLSSQLSCETIYQWYISESLCTCYGLDITI